MGKGRILVGPSFFLLLLFLLPGDTSASTTEPQYLVLVPYLIHTETPEKICVQLNHLNESVRLNATLEHGGQNRTLLTTLVTEKDMFRCIPFQVPKLSSSSSYPGPFLTVEVKGDTLRFRSRKAVLVRDLDTLLFIQTDKPIYKPGQTVRFRVAALDESFRPVTEKIPFIYLQDPKNNRLMQWTEVELKGGLVQLSFPLGSEPPQGTYKLKVQKASKAWKERDFEVSEYVLPKYEVVVKAPKVITIMAEELNVTACGVYTHGMPVPGQVKIRVCRKYNDPRGRVHSGYTSPCSWVEMGGVCEESSGEADVNGCFSQVVKTKVFQMKRDSSQMKLEVEAKIVEEGTGVEQTGNAFSTITTTLSTVAFEKVDTYYKPGIPLFGQAKLVDGANVPIANETVEIRVDQLGRRTNYTTDHQGRFQFSIDMTNCTDSSISIQAIYKPSVGCREWGWLSPHHQSASHSASRFYSPSESYLHIEPVPGTLNCGHIQPVRVHYSLKPGLVEDKKINFHYLVMAKGGIVHSGIHVQPEEHGEAKGVFSLDLPVDVDVAPLARLLLYTVLPNGELVAHSADFTVENCFRNKVTLWISDPRGIPGSPAQIVLASAKDSLCAIHAVDKSVYLLKPEAELSPQTVYDLLPVKNLKGYQHDNHHLNEMSTLPCVARKPIIVDGIRYSPDSYSYNEGDAYELLKDFGLKVFTSTKIHKPQICQEARYGTFHAQSEYEERYGQPVPLAFSAGLEYRGSARLDTAEASKPPRSFFPETWLWQVVLLDADYSGPKGLFGHSEKEGGIVPGETILNVTIPDTITEWQVGAFCLSPDNGIAIAEVVTANPFLPFFVETTLPYSVVRGEAFMMKATTYSYQNTPMEVTMSLAPSPDFEAIPVGEDGPSCLPEKGRKTVSWLVTPKTLGEVNFTVTAKARHCGNAIEVADTREEQDAVIKSVLVEPEGVEKDMVFSNILCPAEKSESTATVALGVPTNVVEGSARASICVLGDIMGTAIENIHQLLQLPYGCGEQNMALFVPNIYILQYLNNTGQLTEEIKSRAIGYLVAGYQKQLNYKHSDGSFSTFGERSWEPGNTWLTAFTLVSFARAKSFIFVEEKHISDAQTSLASRQKENGCFHSTGTLLNNALKGGVDDETTLSAYITIALLQIPLPVTHSVVRNALFCLETATQEKEINTYTKALLAFAFALAGNEDKKQEMLRLLDAEAVEEGDGSLHWQRSGKQDVAADLPFHRLPRAPSAEVEMTAYVLLAYLTKQPAPSQEELAKCVRIVKWLVRQQNPTGGFSSTQDTVVALQALSLYGALTYSRGSTGTDLSVRSGANALGTFHVDNTNRLLLQCLSLPQVPGDYNVEATGDRCVYIQTTLKYNVHPHLEDSPFKLDVHTVPESCAGPKAHKTFDIAVNVSYIGKRPTSNMVILDVKMLSGFIPVKSSVRQLIGKAQVKRTEVSTSHVLLYLEKVDNVTQSLSFTVEQDVPVQHLKPALVKVYDYYETGDSAIAKYSAPCSTDDIKQGNA